MDCTRTNLSEICQNKRLNKCVLRILHEWYTHIMFSQLMNCTVRTFPPWFDHPCCEVYVSKPKTLNTAYNILSVTTTRIYQIYRIPCRLVEGLHGTEESDQSVECFQKVFNQLSKLSGTRTWNDMGQSWEPWQVFIFL